MADFFSTRINGKLGYNNLYGEIIIEPQFDKGIDTFGSDSESKNPFASVMIDNKCGILSEDGVIIIPFIYDEAFPLFENLFFVRKNDINNDWWVGVIDNNNKIIIPLDYKYIEKKDQILQCFKNATSEKIFDNKSFESKGIIFKYSNKYEEVWFNNKGVKIYDGKVIDARFNLLVIEENNKLGLINSNGIQILENKYTEIYCLSNNRFIVRLDFEEDWSFGVLNEKGETIINFNYKYIWSHNGFFFNCFQQCESKRNYNDFRKFSYTSQKGESWFNTEGVLIYEGEAEILSNEFLAAKKNNKWGVYNYSGNRIVNFIYDYIRIIQSKLVVVIDDKIGVLGKFGEMIINPSYVSIECVNNDANRDFYIYNDVDINEITLKSLIADNYENYLCFFNSTGIIDTDYLHQFKIRGIHYSKFWSRSKIMIIHEIDFEKTFILSNEIYSELFSLKEGILSNSRFDQIYQINNENFIVKKNNKWGIFQSYKKELIIPCEFDRILFKGGHIVLLCQNYLWGAKSIIREDQCYFKIFNTDIPILFEDIKILNATQTLFSLKKKDVQSCTIVDRNFREYKNIKCIDIKIDSILFFYNDERILCLSNDKYGFISAYGYISIPFKYDEITKRADNNFNIRIGIKWGVLDLDGREIVQVKYAEQIPNSYKGCEVIDAETGCKGVLDEFGNERIPAIFEYLDFPFSSDIILFAIGLNDFNINDLDFRLRFAKWGCLTHNGKNIIPPKYDYITSYGLYIIAGRNGYKLYNDEYNHAFSGVLDLYNKKGELIIGGFNIFYYCDNYFVFFFGGSWIINNPSLEYIDDEGRSYSIDQNHNIDYGDFHPSSGGWVVLDTNLKTIITPNNGDDYQFKRGFVVEILQEKVEKMTSKTKRRNPGDRNPLPLEIEIHNTYNFPEEIIFKNKPLIYNKYAIINENFSSKIIRLDDKKCSNIYNEIVFLDQNKFFVRQEDKVGIVDFEGNILIPINYVAITYPISKILFGVIETSNNNCNVDFFKQTENCFSIEKAVTDKNLDIVLEKMCEGVFKIFQNIEGSNKESITVKNTSFFDKEFAIKLTENKNLKFKYEGKNKYWFSNHFLLDEPDFFENYNDYRNENNDYEDTWNAMTDGMYGDIPDGFDGDFDFLGH